MSSGGSSFMSLNAQRMSFLPSVILLTFVRWGARYGQARR
jgi:hypothetical protein